MRTICVFKPPTNMIVEARLLASNCVSSAAGPDSVHGSWPFSKRHRASRANFQSADDVFRIREALKHALSSRCASSGQKSPFPEFPSRF